MGGVVCCEEQRVAADKPRVRPVPRIERAQTSRETPKLLREVLSLPVSGDTRGPQKYQSLKYLGRGAFGSVVLAEEKASGKQWAMKIIDKNKIRQFNVLQCKIIQQIGRQEFLVGIKETFQNRKNIYIIMEYLPKGDIYFYLRKKQVRFTEEVIRGIVAEIVIGVAFLHSRGIIYRQLKPENILVTEDGHIKLTDYGLSKVIIEDHTAVLTFVGTLEYMAPEALRGQFGQQADLWAIGILMYELMFEANPFEHEYGKLRAEGSELEYQVTIQRINIQQKLNSKIGWVSQSFRDLLLRLLQKCPQKRISLEGLRSHEFFRGVEWEKVRERKNEGPLRKLIENNDHIKFRDATSEEYIRKKFTRIQPLRDNYEIKLYQFRNSH